MTGTKFSWPGPLALAGVGLVFSGSGSEAPDGRARHRAATEDDANPWTEALHAVQGLLATSGATLQAQPSDRAPTGENFRWQSRVNVVAVPAIAAERSTEALLPFRFAAERGFCVRHLLYQPCDPIQGLLVGDPQSYVPAMCNLLI
jgi:hypothetical protein